MNTELFLLRWSSHSIRFSPLALKTGYLLVSFHHFIKEKHRKIMFKLWLPLILLVSLAMLD